VCGGVEHGGVAVGLGERLGQRTLGEALHLGEHAARGDFVEVGELAGAQPLAEPEHLEEGELDVAEVALVVAHRLAHLGSWRAQLRFATSR